MFRITILISSVLLSGCVSTIPAQDEPQSVVDAKRVFEMVLVESKAQIERITKCESMQATRQWGWAEHCIEANNHSLKAVSGMQEFNKAEGRLIDWGITNLNDTRLWADTRLSLASDLEKFMHETKYFKEMAELKYEQMSVPSCYYRLLTQPFYALPKKGCCNEYRKDLPLALSEPLCRVDQGIKE
jgi:hypothetical protein